MVRFFSVNLGRFLESLNFKDVSTASRIDVAASNFHVRDLFLSRESGEFQVLTIMNGFLSDKLSSLGDRGKNFIRLHKY